MWDSGAAPVIFCGCDQHNDQERLRRENHLFQLTGYSSSFREAGIGTQGEKPGGRSEVGTSEAHWSLACTRVTFG